MFCARPRKDLLSLGRRIVRAITHTTVSRDYFLAFLLLEPSVKWRLLLESVSPLGQAQYSQPYCSGYKLAFGSFTKLTVLRRVAESQDRAKTRRQQRPGGGGDRTVAAAAAGTSVVT